MLETWQTFFATIIGATGSLLGLLFVAISISLPKIVASKGLLSASAQPLFLLFNILVSSVFFLVPDQSLLALGLEVALGGALIGGAATFEGISAFKRAKTSQRARFLSNVVFNALPFGLVVASGVMLISGRPSGYYLMVPAVVVAFFQATTISWAFLVAIHAGGRQLLE